MEASMTEVRKLYILLCGYEIIRKSRCLRGANPAIVLAVPICCYLLETSRGFVLFDTGLDSAPLADVAASRARYVNDAFPAPPLVLAEHELLPQLARIGVAPGDIGEIVLSHAHGDHTGHLRDFPRARVSIQREEYEAVFSAEGRRAEVFAEIGAPEIRWNIVDGDWRLMPGVDVLHTPGHRPGHQSAVVALPREGVKILVGDVADLVENFETETIGGGTDDAAALASIRRLKAIAQSARGELVPLHDPAFVQTARLAPRYYD
jgi:N-acyl homoserine lactone hydrolase